MKLVLAVILLVSAAAAEKFFAEPTERCCVDYCYSTDTVRPQNLHYNTKTAYQFVRGGQSPSVPADCTPSKFWLLTRHGTRLPSSSKIEKLQGLPTYQAEILSNYAGGKKPAVGALCDADLQLLASWQLDNNITVSMDEYLTQQGWNDLKGLATHYKGLYPTLLGGSYSSDRFVFRHTNTQRTQASYRGFVDGLFGDGFHTSITPPIVPTVDTFLKVGYLRLLEIRNGLLNIFLRSLMNIAKPGQTRKTHWRNLAQSCTSSKMERFTTLWLTTCQLRPDIHPHSRLTELNGCLNSASTTCLGSFPNQARGVL